MNDSGDMVFDEVDAIVHISIRSVIDDSCNDSLEYSLYFSNTMVVAPAEVMCTDLN